MFGNYLLDPANTSWEQAVAAQCTAAITRSHDDGCFVDTLGSTAPLDAGYVTGLPMNPSTHATWSAAEWSTATAAIAAAVQSANPGAIVIANGLANGVKYFSTSGATSTLLGPTAAAMAELWLRAPGAGVTQFPSLTKWQANVDMLVDAESHGQSVLTTTKLWVTATAAEQAQWHKFALASFLLGADGLCTSPSSRITRTRRSRTMPGTTWTSVLRWARTRRTAASSSDRSPTGSSR